MNEQNVTVNPPQRSIPPAPSLPEIQLAGGMRLSKWLDLVGISRTTGWRLRKQGKLPVIIRYGTPFLTAEAIRNFFVDDGSRPRGVGKG
jgi:hypothetical protein